VGEGLAYLSESYNCIAHIFSLGFATPRRAPNIQWSNRPGVAR